MTATADQIAELRRKVNDNSVVPTYSDKTLASYIERYRIDAAYWETTSGDAIVATTVIPEEYDMNAAAADIWDEKAAALSEEFDFSADGLSVTISQKREAALKMAKRFRARRAPRSPTMERKDSTFYFDSVNGRYLE